MEALWIAQKNGVVVAAMAERFYDNDPAALVEGLKEFAEIGPIERIITDKRVILGEPL